MKKEALKIGILAILSVVGVIFWFNKDSIIDSINNKEEVVEKVQEDETIQESTKETDTSNEEKFPGIPGNEEVNLVWIKNLNFLLKYQDLDVCMRLKNELTDELRMVDENAYEVNLIESTYEELEDGYKIQADVDVFHSNIGIIYSDYVYEIEFY